MHLASEQTKKNKTNKESKYTQHWCKEKQQHQLFFPALKSKKGDVITSCMSVTFYSDNKRCFLNTNVRVHIPCIVHRHIQPGYRQDERLVFC